ncbi:MAG: hypothetical protein A2Z17_03370 [Gammaproteobacteria bacterium RBG_16_66_13]|nr:MAG: hypothetical protein A2Z17_03370 [Gammaproteobacteria bacterium RBG_16_66_13]
MRVYYDEVLNPQEGHQFRPPPPLPIPRDHQRAMAVDRQPSPSIDDVPVGIRVAQLMKAVPAADIRPHQIARRQNGHILGPFH